MADNAVSDPGTGGVTWRTTEIGGIHHAHTKVEYGSTSEAHSVDDDAGLPVKQDSANPWTVTILGDVAHGAADANNPLKMGAVARTSEHPSVDVGDRVELLSDANGRLVIKPYANISRGISGVTTNITGTSNTQVIAVPGAGLRLVITDVHVQNAHATVNTWVKLKKGTTDFWTGYCRAGGGGFTKSFLAGISMGANTALQVQCETSGAEVRASASGYIEPVEV